MHFSIWTLLDFLPNLNFSSNFPNFQLNQFTTPTPIFSSLPLPTIMQPNNNPYWVKLSNFLLGIALAILLLNLTGGMAQKPPNGDKGSQKMESVTFFLDCLFDFGIVVIYELLVSLGFR